MSKKKIHIEVSEADINRLIDEIENSNLNESSREKLIDALRALMELDRLVGLKSATIARLRKVFSKESEKSKKKDPTEKKEATGRTGGHGRHGQNNYPGSEKVFHVHETLKEKDLCPECQKGKVYSWSPGVYIKVHGQAPLQVVIHETEKLRCNACGAIFEASFKEKEDEKFDSLAKAVIAVLHYKSSLPFYRLEQLQKKLGMPMPRSTLWGEAEKLVNRLQFMWKYFLQRSANGDLFFIDDTKAKILSLIRENELQKENKKFRKGMYTTGVLSEIEAPYVSVVVASK